MRKSCLIYFPILILNCLNASTDFENRKSDQTMARLQKLQESLGPLVQSWDRYKWNPNYGTKADKAPDEVPSRHSSVSKAEKSPMVAELSAKIDGCRAMCDSFEKNIKSFDH